MPAESGYFDVRTTYPPGCDLKNPKVQANADKINRMIFLLEGITYKELYTSPYGLLVQGLIPRLDDAFDVGLISAEQRDGLRQAAEEVVKALEGNSITLQDIFTTKKDELPAGLWEPSVKMDDLGITVTFCRQADSLKDLAKQVFENGFLNDLEDPSGDCGIGDITEFQLYTISARKHSAAQKKVLEAKAASVLEIKPNDMACEWPNCLPYNNLYCALDGVECSLNSDPYPGDPDE